MNTNNFKSSVLVKVSSILLLQLALTPWPCEGHGLGRATTTHPNASYILNTEEAGQRYFYIGDTNISLPCSARGLPLPTMMWERVPDKGQNFTGFLTSQNWTFTQEDDYLNCTLNFSTLERSFEGVYRCRAFNKHGQDSIEYVVAILNPDKFWRGKPWIFVIFLAGLCIFGYLMNFCVNYLSGNNEEDVEENTSEGKENVSKAKATKLDKTVKTDSNNNEMEDYNNNNINNGNKPVQSPAVHKVW